MELEPVLIRSALFMGMPEYGAEDGYATVRILGEYASLFGRLIINLCENFEFTLLEYFGMSYDSKKVLEREQWWKECLDTREHGYNDN